VILPMKNTGEKMQEVVFSLITFPFFDPW